MAPRPLVTLKDVRHGYASRTVLDGVTLGVAAGERIGVVGRNGGGKSTLLGVLGGAVDPDEGARVQETGLALGMLSQADVLPPEATVREVLVGGRPDHEVRADAKLREVLAGLLDGVDATRFPQGLDTVVGPLSGGERRRIALAKLLLEEPELLLLDEPTNHLDVEGVDWLARHLAQRRGALVVVTHDRWFLDAVCTQTWEVTDGVVHQYEGGYAAYVLARAERDRQAAAKDARRRQLLRKELAWLRRGPPARTSKPKFRIEAANALIADEPDPRDTVELLRFSAQRLGSKVVEVEDASVAFGERQVLRGVTWRLGPGDRVALVGVNGSGKTTLLDVLSGTRTPDAGTVDRGATVRLAQLTQEAAELPRDRRVLEALTEVRERARLADGTELTAGMLCERFGFRGDRQRALVQDLSGGERRRLALMRLLMGEPNVLLLDEPTNDLDTDTLAALEDLLDGWPGTLVVVSHDRYFVERVCDDVYALAAGGRGLRHLPGGIEQYLSERHRVTEQRAAAGGAGGSARKPDGAPPPQAVLRAARKEAARAERALDKLAAAEEALHEEMAAHATDHGRLRELQERLAALQADREREEAAWMEASEVVEAGA